MGLPSYNDQRTKCDVPDRGKSSRIYMHLNWIFVKYEVKGGSYVRLIDKNEEFFKT